MPSKFNEADLAYFQSLLDKMKKISSSIDTAYGAQHHLWGALRNICQTLRDVGILEEYDDRLTDKARRSGLHL